jgi:hypothetical protein
LMLFLFPLDVLFMLATPTFRSHNVRRHAHGISDRC